jgi:aryl-alcohol dehydrogenase-like predicted oxidoreductase
MDSNESQFKKVEQRKLGSQGLVASAQGLGTMGMTAFYSSDEVTEEEKINTIGRALELGINFLDTAWIYVNFKTGETNEALVGKALKKYGRENFVVATKCGIEFTANGPIISGKPELIRKQCEESLKRLDIDCIDLYYLHRIDSDYPIEETMKVMLELKQEGKIKQVGLSECTPDELERAHKVFPITAIQMEWSLQTRDIEKTLVPVARKLGVAIVAYSPLGRGLLSRTFTKREDIKDGDYRISTPRFNQENFDENALAAQKLEEFAKSRGYTSAQIALAWLHNQGDDVFPIPGTKSAKRIEENSQAVHIKLTKEEMQEIESIIPEGKGGRYDENFMKNSYEARI